MSHTVRDKKRLLARVRRIRGQIEAIERGLLEERDSYGILQTAAACRGALNSLVSEIIQGHVRYHLLDPEKKTSHKQREAAAQIADIVKSYLK